jgi:hypothetical protein
MGINLPVEQLYTARHNSHFIHKQVIRGAKGFPSEFTFLSLADDNPGIKSHTKTQDPY